MITDGHFVGVAAQVFYYLLRSAKRPLGIHHPILCKQAVNKCFVIHPAGAQLSHIFCPEHLAQSLYGKQVFIAAQMCLPNTIFVYAATRYNAVQVRVKR